MEKDRRAGIAPNADQTAFEHEHIQTTKTRALAIRGDAERLITLAPGAAPRAVILKVMPADLRLPAWATLIL